MWQWLLVRLSSAVAVITPRPVTALRARSTRIQSLGAFAARVQPLRAKSTRIQSLGAKF